MVFQCQMMHETGQGIFASLRFQERPGVLEQIATGKVATNESESSARICLHSWLLWITRLNSFPASMTLR